MQNIDELLPNAKEILKQSALKEAEKAEQFTPNNWLRPMPKSGI